MSVVFSGVRSDARRVTNVCGIHVFALFCVDGGRVSRYRRGECRMTQGVMLEK